MIRASAPGSIMVTGEHAVVYGHRAIVAAIEQRVTVTLSPRSDGQVCLHSEIAEDYLAPLSDITVQGPYRFVLAALMRHRSALASGVTLNITSQINPTLGLGSSAAVTIAVLGALYALRQLPRDGLHHEAHAIIQEIQGRGSGADLAASFHGGMIAYKAPPDSEIIALPKPPEFALRYCGYKTPTAQVLSMIAARMEGNEAQFERLYSTMGHSAEAAISAALGEDWSAFAEALSTYQGLMVELGVCDETLGQIITQARRDPCVTAAKISGSGLGDCVLALGGVPDGFAPAPLALKGLVIDD